MRKLVDHLNSWILKKKVNAKQPLEREEYTKWIMEYAQVTRYDSFGERVASHFNVYIEMNHFAFLFWEIITFSLFTCSEQIVHPD